MRSQGIPHHDTGLAGHVAVDSQVNVVVCFDDFVGNCFDCLFYALACTRRLVAACYCQGWSCGDFRRWN